MRAWNSPDAATLLNRHCHCNTNLDARHVERRSAKGAGSWEPGTLGYVMATAKGPDRGCKRFLSPPARRAALRLLPNRAPSSNGAGPLKSRRATATGAPSLNEVGWPPGDTSLIFGNGRKLGRAHRR